MKIHAFKVVCRGGPSLDEVLKIISGLPLEERMRTISGGSIRLENANRVSAGWFLDFGGLRPEGPGRESPTAPITDIELAEDELFVKKPPLSTIPSQSLLFCNTTISVLAQDGFRDIFIVFRKSLLANRKMTSRVSHQMGSRWSRSKIRFGRGFE